MTRHRIALLALAIIAFSPATAFASLNVFACEPEWAALVREIAGDKASIHTATTAAQDPHHIQARPSLIARARNADLAVCTGAELEAGWLPLLQRQAGNPRIQPGANGYFEAAHYVRLLEVPTRLDRSQGDVHASGNPHFHVDPRRIAAVAEPLALRLGLLDPANASLYQERYTEFSARWASSIQQWEAKAAPLRGVLAVTHHRNWTYLIDWLGLRDAGTLEPIPGIPPSSASIARNMDAWRQQSVRLIVRATYEDHRPADFAKEHLGAAIAVLPATVGGTDGAKDLFGLFDDIVSRLLRAHNAE